jgi:hypothetical protein
MPKNIANPPVPSGTIRPPTRTLQFSTNAAMRKNAMADKMNAAPPIMKTTYKN